MGAADREIFDSTLIRALASMGLTIETDYRMRMYAHYERLVEANRRLNLTRITSPGDAALKHYADSLSLLAAGWQMTDQRLSVVDVGTGGGLPAVPLAIVRGFWHVTALDGTGKKVRFVADSADALGLSNLRAVHARAADLARQGAAAFGLALVRAVGRIEQVLPEVWPLLIRGGSVVFYKSDKAEQEIDRARKVADKLRLHREIHRIVFGSGSETLRRQLVRYQKKT